MRATPARGPITAPAIHAFDVLLLSPSVEDGVSVEPSGELLPEFPLPPVLPDSLELDVLIKK